MRNRFILVAVLAAACASDPAPQTVDQRLEQSPRHHEWVAISQGDRTVHAFLVFPESKAPATAVVVIHENRGLTDWVRAIADDLAAAGYIAIAPDLLSGLGPDGGKTSDFPDGDAAREAIYQLPPDQVTADLHAVADYVAQLPAANGKVAVAGFCWGGSQSFRFATNRSDLGAAYVFYGTGPDDAEAVARINCPVEGFYGGADARVGATVPITAELMEGADKRYQPVTYDGAGHGFMRAGEAPDASEANRKARTMAWERWLGLLEKI